MIFAGLHKSSLIDYPDKVSCILFTTGCNFTCPFCHNPELARGRYPDRIDESEAYAFLEARRGLLDGVVISGGEPTLQPDIVALCARIREMGYAVKLDTNGSRPDVLRALMAAGVVDYIAMDIKTDPGAYPRELCPTGMTAKIQASIDLILGASMAYEFRTTCVKPYIDDRIIETIARRIQGAKRYALHAFKDETTLEPARYAHHDRSWTPQEMETFRKLAAPFVAECLLR